MTAPFKCFNNHTDYCNYSWKPFIILIWPWNCLSGCSTFSFWACLGFNAGVARVKMVIFFTLTLLLWLNSTISSKINPFCPCRRRVFEFYLVITFITLITWRSTQSSKRNKGNWSISHQLINAQEAVSNQNIRHLGNSSSVPTPHLTAQFCSWPTSTVSIMG